MKQTKKARLEAAGWRVSDAAEFLGLSDDERRFVELKLALASGGAREAAPLESIAGGEDGGG